MLIIVISQDLHASHTTKLVQKGLLCCHGLHGVECIFACDMSASHVNGRFKVKCHEFFAAFSEEMLAYINSHGEDV